MIRWFIEATVFSIFFVARFLFVIVALVAYAPDFIAWLVRVP